MYIKFSTRLTALLSALLLGNSTAWAIDPIDPADAVEIMNAQHLKKAGAEKLAVYFERSQDGSMTKTAWLLGLKHAKIQWKKPLHLKNEVNTAKTDVDCRQGQIVIISQFPGSAAFIKQTFIWDGSNAKFLSTQQGDPSQDCVQELKQIALKGTRAQLNAWLDKDEDRAIMYPANYVNTDTVQKILDTGHKAALNLNSTKMRAQAADRLALCFDACTQMIAIAYGADDNDSIPDKWISAWNTDAIQLPVAVWAPMLNDYGYFLQENGNHKDAIKMMNAVLKVLPDRPPVYLNLADSLWATNQRPEAKQMYAKYKELSQKDHAKSIPARVIERAGG